MKCRRLTAAELPDILRLYTFLHPDDPPVDASGDEVKRVWAKIASNENLRYYGAKTGGRLVATCTLAVIPNLTSPALWSGCRWLPCGWLA